MIKRRADEASKHWEKTYNLAKVRQSNSKLYNTDYAKEKLRDARYEDIFADNRLFTATRTVLPFITSRITQPEVTPANGTDTAIQFAADFEKTMVELADSLYARDKIKLAVQDLLAGQRVGVLKWVYNPAKDCLALEHCDPASILVDGHTALHDEPTFIQHSQERSVGELLRQFPSKKEAIFRIFKIQKGVASQLEQRYRITENWMFVDNDRGEQQLVIVWEYNGTILGKITDPNWREKKENVVPDHMMPFVFFNFLNDGKGYIDHTSFIEQAEHSQRNYDRRGQTIAENAQYGGVGVPVFASGAIKAETAAKVQFSPVQRIVLDTDDLSKSFTTWNTQNLPNYIVEDKFDLRNNIDNIFGTPNVFRGEQSQNNTLGQDVLIRDQAEGRQQELVDCIDAAMQRFYLLEAQLIYRYFDKEKFYNFIGDDGQFEEVVISQAKIAKNVGVKIKVKSGSSLPVDRAQKRATAVKLLEMNKIGTLRAYKELGIDEPEEAFKQFLLEQAAPAQLLSEVDKGLFNSEAERDLQVVIGGQVPKEREDLHPEYIAHLNEYLLTDKYHQLPNKAQLAVSDFVQAVIVKAQEKLAKMEQQMPSPEEVAAEEAAAQPTDEQGNPIPPEQPQEPPTPGLSPV